MFPLFNALLAPLLPGLWAWTAFRRYGQKKSAASFAAQWGRVTPAMRAFGRASGPRVWIHAVSVGETMAAKPILRALRDEIPGVRLALSNTTDAGRELGLMLERSGEVDLAFGFPLDVPFVLAPVLNAIRPDAIGFVETELWPNLLHMAARRGIPTFLLNGRVSDNLLKTAPKLGPLWRWMSGNVARFLMRGEADAARLRALGVAPEKIVVVGDIKLEAPPVQSAELRALWRDRLGLTTEPLLVAGSTHEGEEQMLLRAFTSLRETNPALRLALVPRHLDRAPAIADQIQGAGWRVVRRSLNDAPDATSVYLLDSTGELADFYAAADVAVVGGTLIERGGHNLLEPVLRGAPVVFGPSVANFRAAAELILANGLGAQTTPDALADTLAAWLARPKAGYVARVAGVLAPHQGAATRMAREVAGAVEFVKRI